MADTEAAEGPGVGHEQRSRIGGRWSAAPTRSRAAAQRNGTATPGQQPGQDSQSEERRPRPHQSSSISRRTRRRSLRNSARAWRRAIRALARGAGPVVVAVAGMLQVGGGRLQADKASVIRARARIIAAAVPLARRGPRAPSGAAARARPIRGAEGGRRDRRAWPRDRTGPWRPRRRPVGRCAQQKRCDPRRPLRSR